LDAKGSCCDGGRVDACGTCNGTGVALDAHNQCCTGRLDAAGVCCPASGAVDECGVCGGSAACSVRLRMLVQLANPALYLSPNGIPNKRLRVAVQDQIATAVTAQRGAPFDRALVGVVLSAAAGADGAAGDGLGRLRRARDAGGDAGESDSGAATDGSSLVADAVAVKSSSGSSTSSRATRAPTTSAALLAPPAVRPASGASDSSSNTAVDPGQLSVEITIRSGGGASPPNTGAALAAAAGLVGSSLAAPGARDGRLSFGRLETLLRVGTCGNGVCEVGERPTGDNPNEGCPADCAFPFLSCPPYAAPDNNSTRFPGWLDSGKNSSSSSSSETAASTKPPSCSGFGACFNALGACSCYAGYAGPDCGACARGYARVGGYCVTIPRAPAARAACAGPDCLDTMAAAAAAAAAAAIAQARAAVAAEQLRARRGEKWVLNGVTVGAICSVLAAALVTYRSHNRWLLMAHWATLSGLMKQPGE
jgi:hypothetical protein